MNPRNAKNTKSDENKHKQQKKNFSPQLWTKSVKKAKPYNAGQILSVRKHQDDSSPMTKK